MNIHEHQVERRNAVLPGENEEDLRNERRLQMRVDLKRQNGMKPHVISVKLPSYDIINVCLSIVPGFLIWSFKSFLNDAILQRGFIGISPERMRLLYAGRELQDSWEVLDCKIDGKHTLDIVLRMQPVSEEEKGDSRPGEPSHPSTRIGYGDDNTEHCSAPGFTAHNYGYREFLRKSSPEHNAVDVPIEPQIKLVFGPHPRGVHLVLPAMLESSAWEHYLQSLGGLKMAPETAASTPADAKHPHASRPGNPTPHAEKVAAEPSAVPTLEKTGDMLRHFGGDLEAAKGRGFVKWTHEKLPRRVFLVEAAQDLYDRLPNPNPDVRNGVSEILLQAMLHTDKGKDEDEDKVKDKDKAKDKDKVKDTCSGANSNSLSEAEDGEIPHVGLTLTQTPHVGLAGDGVSAVGSVAGSVSIRASFNPASSTAGPDPAALAQEKQSRAQTAARDAALDEIRYNWKGVNRGYCGGDAYSWQRYTHEFPVDARTELRGHRSANEGMTVAPTEVPLLQHLFGYRPSARTTFDSFAYAFSASSQAEGTAPAVLLLPAVQHSGNIPTRDEVLGLRLGQRRTAAAPRWPSCADQPPAAGQVLADTPLHWLHAFSALDDDRTYELVLTPTEPLKYDSEYFIVLANGVPVLPAGDMLAATYGFAAAGQTSEDLIIRFRTVAAPPPLSKKEEKILRSDLRRKAINNLQTPWSARKVWVDLKTIDWDALNEWPKPPCVQIDDSASEYTKDFEEEEEEDREQ